MCSNRNSPPLFPPQGHGWWKYEFCYSRHVRQYHVHKGGEESSIVLGTYDERAYREWLAANPDKRIASTAAAASAQSSTGANSRALLWSFYGSGAVCELTGRPRHTEIKLKCTDPAAAVTVSATKTTTQLYLLEPATCEYVLSVESPLVCELLRHVDAEGAMPTAAATVEDVAAAQGEEEEDWKVVTWIV